MLTIQTTEHMSIQEKRGIVSLVSSLLITAIYFLVVLRSYPEGMTTDEELKFWAKTLLILIPVKIVGMIVLHILFSVSSAIATGKEPEGRTDERDKLIELKSTRNSQYVFIAGFLLAMGALALGKSVTTMFVVLISFGILSEILDSASKLYFYRKGI